MIYVLHQRNIFKKKQWCKTMTAEKISSIQQINNWKHIRTNMNVNSAIKS